MSEAIFTYMRVEHRVSAPYHPQTNGNIYYIKNFLDLSSLLK